MAEKKEVGNMLYIRGTDTDGALKYNLFETHTESTIACEVKHIGKLVKKHGMILKNATINDGELKLNKWPHSMINSSMRFRDYYGDILLAKTNDNRFKILVANATIQYISERELKSRILEGQLSNCDYLKDNTETIFKSIDTTTITRDKSFEKHIAKKYEEYIAKTKLLGMSSEFSYTIEGKEVKLKKYTGTSKKIILPGFITTITGNAFYGLKTEEVNLNDGLMYIGSSAFEYNNIESVRIPGTVKFIGSNAFSGNTALMKTKVVNRSMKPKIIGYNEKTFILGSSKTIVIDNILGTIRR